MRKVLICCSSVAAVLWAASALSPVFAVCTISSQPLQHYLGGYFMNCPDAQPVKAFAYALSTRIAPDTSCPDLVSNAQCTGAGTPASCCTGAGTGTCIPCNTAGIDIACEDSSGQNGQGGGCQAEAGTAGDGKVTILFDWAGPGIYPGCPDPNQQLDIGRNFVQLVANNGSSIMVSVSFSFDLLAYAIDMAEPDTSPAGPLSCSPAANCTGGSTPGKVCATNADCGAGGACTKGGLYCTGGPTPGKVCATNSDCGAGGACMEATGIIAGSYDGTTFCGTVPVPVVHTDCDAGTWGVTGGGIFAPICNPSTLPALARGKLYSKTDTCGTSPDTTLSSGWTLLPVAPDANTGAFCVPIPKPSGINQCAFVAASGRVGGVETLAAVGATQLAGQNAPSARAFVDSANAGGNNVSISFHTVGELGLVGFNVLTDAQGGKNRIKVNSALITPKGVQGGGASYAVQIPRGNFKGSKVLYIESVLTSGTLLSDPATF